MKLIPQSRPLTAADLESMPDDGYRYELIDGAYVERATAAADETVRIEAPLPLAIVASDLAR